MIPTLLLSTVLLSNQAPALSWRVSCQLHSTYLPVQLDTILEQTVTDGGSKIQRTQTKSRVSWAGELLMSPNESVTGLFQLDETGKVIAVTAPPNDNGWGIREFQLEEPPQPPHGIVAGGSWTQEFPANPTTGAVSAHGSYQLISDKQVGEDLVQEIQFEVHETEGASPASAKGAAQVRKKDGVVLSLNLEIKNAAIPGIPGLASGSIRRTLLRG